MPRAPVRIVAIGRSGAGPERALFERYAGRLRPKPVLVELPDARGSVLEIRRREADAILGCLPDRSLIVALDVDGEALDSAAFAERCGSWHEFGRQLAFVIGGAEGIDRTLLERANVRLSLGPQTWPHLLARVMLAEQLYRAQSILEGHPYHRASRP